MAGNFRKEDLRINKAKAALLKALSKLLERRSFERLTVNNLCVEAELSRVTFYSHFKDKYDLLNYWLIMLKAELVHTGDTYVDIERRVNGYIEDHGQVISNLLEAPNDETLDLLHSFMVSILIRETDQDIEKERSDRHIVFTNFCAGGMVHLLMWQKKNRFPRDLKMVNPHFYGMLVCLLNWETDHE